MPPRLTGIRKSIIFLLGIIPDDSVNLSITPELIEKKVAACHNQLIPFFQEGEEMTRQRKSLATVLVFIGVALFVAFWPGKSRSAGWEKAIGGSEHEYGISVIQNKDGDFIVTGMTRSYGASGDDLWLVKTNANGNLQWGKLFGEPSMTMANQSCRLMTAATLSLAVLTPSVWVRMMSG